MQTRHLFDLYLTSVFRNQLKFVPFKSLRGQKFEMNIFNVTLVNFEGNFSSLVTLELMYMNRK